MRSTKGVTNACRMWCRMSRAWRGGDAAATEIETKDVVIDYREQIDTSQDTKREAENDVHQEI